MLSRLTKRFVQNVQKINTLCTTQKALSNKRQQNMYGFVHQPYDLIYTKHEQSQLQVSITMYIY